MVRVRITNSEMLNLITKYTLVDQEAPELLSHIYEHGFVFNEFTLIWEDMYTYKVKIDGVLDNQTIHVKKIIRSKEGCHGHKNIDFTLADYLNNLGKSLLDNKGKSIKDITMESVRETWSVDYIPVVSFMQYALYQAMHREIVHKDKTDKVYKKSSRKTKYTPKMEYTLNEVIVRYSEHINHSKHVITCPKWDVKGHPRHLKSGKITWVKPFTKGKDRNSTPADRTYKLSGI